MRNSLESDVNTLINNTADVFVSWNVVVNALPVFRQMGQVVLSSFMVFIATPHEILFRQVPDKVPLFLLFIYFLLPYCGDGRQG